MKISLISLGCDKNLVDSEQMAGLLLREGFTFTGNEEEADIIVINSCCFIHDAKQESIDTIIECGRYKEEGRLKFLIVAGCLAERYSDEIKEELPEVDAVVGTTAFDAIVSVIKGLMEKEELQGGPVMRKEDKDRLSFPDVRRSISTPGHYEYLKIAEGCNKNCSYCIIPKIRGRYRSVPMERLLKDTKELVSEGVKELILVAQETTLYGIDLYGEKKLPELLEKLSGIEGIEWIRLMYCYPEEIDKELILAIKELPKVCHYLDMPLQHCSDRILKAMGRRTRKEEIRSLIRSLREEIPDITLRTTLITGFPGETEEDHKELLDFVQEIRFDRLGVFSYSPEEGTAAFDMPERPPLETAERRREEIYSLQREIALSLQEALLGEELECMVEGRIPEDGVLTLRTRRDAPDIDGMLFIPEGQDTKGLVTGDMIRARVTGYSDYDLKGDIVTENEPSE